MSSNDQGDNTNKDSGDVDDQKKKTASSKTGGPDIFSLDSIDDSWLDDKEDFSTTSKSIGSPANEEGPQTQSNLQKNIPPSKSFQPALSPNPVSPNSQPIAKDSDFDRIQEPASAKPPELQIKQPGSPDLAQIQNKQSSPPQAPPPLPPPPTPPSLPSTIAPGRNTAAQNDQSSSSTVDTSNNLPVTNSESTVQSPSSASSSSSPKQAGPNMSQQALEPIPNPGVPKAGVIPTNLNSAEGAQDSSLDQKSKEFDLSKTGFHGWVHKAPVMRFHGEYRKLGEYSKNEQSVSSDVESSAAGAAIQESKRMEASSGDHDSSIKGTVSNMVPKSVGDPGNQSNVSSAPLTEDLLSGSFKSPQSSKVKEPIYHEVGQPAPPAEDELSISQMLKRDFQNDPLINGNLEQDLNQSNSSPVSRAHPDHQLTGASESKSNSPAGPDLPLAQQLSLPESKPNLPDPGAPPAKHTRNGQKFTKSNGPAELDSKPGSSASGSSHLSRKDFSKSDASRRMPFRLIVGAVVLIGIVIGAGIYQFKDSIGGKEPKKKDEIATELPGSTSSVDTKTPASPQKDRVKNWQRDFDKGLRYLGQKNYEKAIVYLSTSIAEEGDHAEVYHSRGRAYSKTKNYDLAVKDFTEALKLKRKDENILLDRAAAYVYSDKLKKAIRDYSKILTINPSNSKASYGRGLVYVKLNKYKKALSDFESTIEVDPYYVNGYLRIGMINAAQDQNDKAIESFSKALKYEKRADIYYERALAFYAQSNLDEAISDLTEAIALKSDKKEYYNDRGYVYLKMGKSKNAKKDFESALNLDPQYKLAKQNLAKVSDQ